MATTNEYKISLVGLWNADETLFDGITNLDGTVEFDRLALISDILQECGEFETIWQGNIQYGKHAIYNWWLTRKSQYQRMWDALNVEYAPLDNYNRYEETIDKGSHEQETKNNAGGYTTNSEHDKSKTDTETGGKDTLRKTAWDASALATSEEEYTENTNHSETDVNNSGRIDTTTNSTGKETGETENKHTSHIHGNIGVTTSAQMLTGELEIRMYDIYTKITNEFCKRFCVCLY